MSAILQPKTNSRSEKVVIITVNYRQNQLTLDCIQSILSLNYPDFEIVLVDNGPSVQDSANLKDRLNERVMYKKLSENRGYVGGINYGLSVAKNLEPAYILIMNNDTVIDAAALGELVKASHTFHDQCIVTGKTYHYDEPNKVQYIGHLAVNEKLLRFNRIGANEEDHGQYDEIRERDLLDDIFWLIPAEVLAKTGNYNEYFWFNGESADYALRAKKLGCKLIYTPKAKLWHKGSISAGGRNNNPKLTYWQIQSTLIFRFLHLTACRFVIFYLILISSIIWGYFKSLRMPRNDRRSWTEQLRAKVYAIMYFNRWIFTRNTNNGYNPFN